MPRRTCRVAIRFWQAGKPLEKVFPEDSLESSDGTRLAGERRRQMLEELKHRFASRRSRGREAAAHKPAKARAMLLEQPPQPVNLTKRKPLQRRRGGVAAQATEQDPQQLPELGGTQLTAAQHRRQQNRKCPPASVPASAIAAQKPPASHLPFRRTARRVAPQEAVADHRVHGAAVGTLLRFGLACRLGISGRWHCLYWVHLVGSNCLSTALQGAPALLGATESCRNVTGTGATAHNVNSAQKRRSVGP